MGSSVVDTNKLVTEVPWSMQKLARMVTRGFYGIEHLIVMDQLIRNTCMREEELRDVTKFEAKMLRSILLALKADKLVKEKQEIIDIPGGRPIRNNYYFINYLTLINVLKYKIDHIRKKLNAEEMQQAHSALYKCTKCSKSYSDLDIGQLWNGLEMQCSFCHGSVEEDPSALPSQSSRSLIAEFNEQISPFLHILQEVEDIRLAPFLLNPLPKPIKIEGAESADDKLHASGDGLMPGLGGRMSNKIKAGGGFDLLASGSSEISVRIEGHDGDHDSRSDGNAGVKQVPVWLRESTVAKTDAPGTTTATTMSSFASPTREANILGKSPPTAHPNDIMQILSAHERHKSDEPLLSPTLKPDDPRHHEHDHDHQNESDFEDVAEAHRITVGGKEYSLAQCTPEIVAQMTPEEKAQYMAASEAAYELLYE